jgi:dimethylaniline monooxygenase (N-oxide forming)
MGLIQPWGAINPMTELQARWVIRVFKGERQLPSRVEMDKDIDERLFQMSRRYVASPRHTIQVDYVEYCNELADEVGCRPNTCEINRRYASYDQNYLYIFSTLSTQ